MTFLLKGLIQSTIHRGSIFITSCQTISILRSAQLALRFLFTSRTEYPFIPEESTPSRNYPRFTKFLGCYSTGTPLSKQQIHSEGVRAYSFRVTNIPGGMFRFYDYPSSLRATYIRKWSACLFFQDARREVGDSQAKEDKVYRMYGRVRVEPRRYSRASNALLLTPLVK